MSSDFASWCISLSVFLALMAKINISFAFAHMDPSLNIFFKIDDLKVGKTLPIYFPNKNLSASPHLLSREEANSIPFSSAKLPQLIKFFSFSKDSSQAKAMEYTLRECELEPSEVEVRFCATSLESMLDFARSVFGLDTEIGVLTTTFVEKPTISLQNYTIFGMPKRLPGSRVIACHPLPYPYAVFYCHGQKSETRVFQVSLLGGENGDRVEAPAACHMVTSRWEPDHVSFRLLKIKPGSSPVCHFFPPDHLVWVPNLPA